MSVEIAVIGAQRPFVLEALEQEFTVHKVWEAADKVAALAPVAARVRGVVTHAMAGLSKGTDDLVSERAYLRRTLPRAVARNLADAARGRSVAHALRAATVLVGVAAAGYGGAVESLSTLRTERPTTAIGATR